MKRRANLLDQDDSGRAYPYCGLSLLCVMAGWILRKRPEAPMERLFQVLGAMLWRVRDLGWVISCKHGRATRFPRAMGGPRAGLCWPFTPEANPQVEIDNLAAASDSGMQLSGPLHHLEQMSKNPRLRGARNGHTSKMYNRVLFKASGDGEPLKFNIRFSRRENL